jgi:hypothetical protein
MKLKIDVTHEDIQNGRRNDCFACPVALAFKRAGFDHPYVWYTSVWEYEGSKNRKAILPDSAREFIDAYDTGLILDPFSFEVEVSDELA